MKTIRACFLLTSRPIFSFGEPHVSQHAAGGHKERLTSTAKAPREGNRTPMNKIKYSEERDPETGFSYFGARYYAPNLSAL